MDSVKHEKVDILLPPDFKKSGVIKTRAEALRDHEWVGVGNLWILQDLPNPAILYHQKSARKSWEPGKVGVVAGGHYQAGEGVDGLLREVKEEIGREYSQDNLTYIGKRLYVGLENNGVHIRQNVVDIFIVKDNTPLKNFVLEPVEVAAICAIPLSELIKMYNNHVNYKFNVVGISHSGNKFTIEISKESFPLNWDNYHRRMVYIAKRFLEGEKNINYQE
ncbi:NUDIX domain-containing protein [Candidatus Woesebacteria bacterium]|nr:NUDIX domain-containing protein [Candidatus Woesebacteria bacterium]